MRTQRHATLWASKMIEPLIKGLETNVSLLKKNLMKKHPLKKHPYIRRQVSTKPSILLLLRLTSPLLPAPTPS